MIWLKMLPVILSGISWVFLFGVGYYVGSDQTKQRFTLEEQQRTILYQDKIATLVSQIRSQELANQSRINELISNQLINEENIKNEYEKVISDLRDGKYDVSDGMHIGKDCSATSNAVSAGTTDTSNLICFTESELYRKIERSMAIAKEADQLAVKYNTLLEVCKAEQVSHDGK